MAAHQLHDVSYATAEAIAEGREVIRNTPHLIGVEFVSEQCLTFFANSREVDLEDAKRISQEHLSQTVPSPFPEQHRDQRIFTTPDGVVVRVVTTSLKHDIEPMGCGTAIVSVMCVVLALVLCL